MIDSFLADVVRSIHASGWQLVASVTGGGSGGIAALLQTPGASRTVLEAVVPYSHSALVEWLGGAPDRSCSAETAQAMAMAAFMRARSLAPAANSHRLLGVGCTASLASDRPKRGDHRVHVAAQTADDAWSYSLVLTKGRRDRAGEESVAAAMLVRSVGAACGVDFQSVEHLLPASGDEERVELDHERPPRAVTALLLRERLCAVLKENSTVEYYEPAETPRLPVVFPGSFNPPHQGHLQMAAEAERRLQSPVAWELSMANVDKPPVDFISMRTRMAGLRRIDGQRLAAVTWAPSFREKAYLFPRATFIVGADTIVRIGDDRYYGGDSGQRDAAIAAIASQECRFLVFGREISGRFQVLGDLPAPPALRAICDEVPAAEFRQDVSSTVLRGGA